MALTPRTNGSTLPARTSVNVPISLGKSSSCVIVSAVMIEHLIHEKQHHIIRYD
ncbi:hypothetical protein [Moraxella lacunata]|uniref:hypothetical protein n=1 Tax=Moraxella lacunata TaxID=477 RepID=UPI003EDF18CD